MSATVNTRRWVETRNCPICGGQKRELSDGMARERGPQLQGLYYLKPIAAALEISLEELVERARTYKCLSCGNYYCDPWFSRELSSSLFSSKGSDHLFAWGNFENWLHRRPARLTANEKLFAIVTRRIGPLSSYAEFGCPFQGFLQLFKGFETGPSARIGLFARALNRETDIRWSRITRFYNAIQRLSGRLAVLALRLRGVLVSIASFDKRADRKEPDVASLPKLRYLLTRDTAIGWGSNCVRYGASCRYFAHTVLGADVIPFDEARAGGLTHFDLIGIFNSLDHTTFPLDVIRKSLELARHVLLVTHHSTRAGKQHWFAFGDDFAAWLGKSIEGIVAVDLHREVDPTGRDCNYILLSRKTGIQ